VAKVLKCGDDHCADVISQIEAAIKEKA